METRTFRDSDPFLTVAEAAAALGISEATIWRKLRSGKLQSVIREGRRLIPSHALTAFKTRTEPDDIPPFTLSNPMFSMIGMASSDGEGPGSEDKHAALDG